MDDVLRVRHRESGVMQARTGPAGKHDVMRIALALQEHEHQVVGAVDCDVFRQTETYGGIEVAGALHLRRHDLEMIDAVRTWSLEHLELTHHARPRAHGR